MEFLESDEFGIIKEYSTNFGKERLRIDSYLKLLLAPGMGFEPMRTVRFTGSQGPRDNHSAIPARVSNLFIAVG